nr:hypothetical protein [uncultured Prevotella sp.]
MFISKKDIISLLDFVLDKVLSNKYSALNIAKPIKGAKLEDIIHETMKELQIQPLEMFFVDDAYDPRSLRRHWDLFDRNFEGNLNDEYKYSYGRLIDELLSFVDQIKSLCMSQPKQRQSTTKILDVKDMDEKLLRLSRSRDKVKEEIAYQNLKPQKDDEIIKMLKNQLDKLDAEYLAVLEAKKKLTFDNMAEQNISEKVSKAFDSLKEYTTVIEDERYRAKIEYYIFLGTICILFLVFIVFYGVFVYILNSHKEDFVSWINFMPYTAFVPIVVALIWLSVYLKGRASKISIELSSRLFNIHYLEGLMKMTNSLSITPEEAVRKIDHATSILMNNYLSQVKENNFTENDVSKLEISELKSNPYWKFLQELKSLIKLIKQ